MTTGYDVMLYGGLALAIIFAGIAVFLFVKLNIPKVIGDLTGSTAKKQIQEIREKGYESIQGAGASKKDAIKAKGDTTRISARDVSSAEKPTSIGKSSRLTIKPAVAEKSQERYRKAIQELEAEEATNVLSEDYEEATNVLAENDPDGATDVLTEDYADEATDVLSEDYEEATNVLAENDPDGATDILTEDYADEATDVLSEDYADEATNVLTESYDDDATDVLSNVDYEGETDVLSSDYDDDATNVLVSEVEETPYQSAKVKLIYDIVVVHTEERI